MEYSKSGTYINSRPFPPQGMSNWGPMLKDYIVGGQEDQAEEVASLKDQIIALTERIEQLEDEFYEHKYTNS